MILTQADARFRSHTSPLEDWLQNSDICVLVAENHDHIIGYIVGSVAGIVYDIALDAHTYHAGLGRALWQSLRAWFAQHHLDPITIRVPRHFPVEQAFWRALVQQGQKTPNGRYPQSTCG